MGRGRHAFYQRHYTRDMLYPHPSEHLFQRQGNCIVATKCKPHLGRMKSTSRERDGLFAIEKLVWCGVLDIPFSAISEKIFKQRCLREGCVNPLHWRASFTHPEFNKFLEKVAAQMFGPDPELWPRTWMTKTDGWFFICNLESVGPVYGMYPDEAREPFKPSV